MAHGYLGDGYGKNGMRDPDGERRNDERGEWRDRGDRRNDEDRGRFMFENRDRDRDDDRDTDRGFFSRTADEARDWFRDDEHDYRPTSQVRWSSENRYSREQPRGERFSGDEHSHYRNWRQQQIDALDRDYQDYCSERQQQFHQDFDSLRRNRPSDNRASQPSGQQSDELQLTAAQEMDATPGGTTDTGQARGTAAGAIDTATLGTNNDENSHVGRK